MRKIHRLPLTGTALSFRSPVVASQDRHGAAVRSNALIGRGQFESNLGLKVLRGAEYMIGRKRVKAAELRNYSLADQKRKKYIEGTGRYLSIHEYFGTRAADKAKNARRKGNLITSELYRNKLIADLHDRFQESWYRALYRNTINLDLGSGLTTNVAALAHANEAVTLASPSGARINLMFLANQHFTGTGATAAAATDIAMQTISTQGGQTAVAGSQSLVSAANSQKYQTVATVSYTGSEAVTEWGLHTSATRSSTTGSPFTATSANSFTGTSTPYTASSTTVQGLQQSIVQAGTTAVWGFVISNTTSVGTIPAWYKTADGTAGSTPGSTETYTIRPILYDHKVFSAVNVINGDSIQFTYQLTVASGN